jgi:WD40 repeat protein/uncharacterized caspase-like protein
MRSRLPFALGLCLLLTAPARGQEVRLVVQTAHSAGVNAVAFSPDGKVVATGSRDQTIKLWHAATGAVLRTLAGFNGEVSAVAFSHDGEYLAAAGTDQSLRVWNPTSGQFLFVIDQKAGRLRAVAVSPDHKWLASGGDGATFLYEVGGGKVGGTDRTVVNGARALAFAPNGRQLAAACADRTVKVLEAPGGRLLHTLAGHTQAVTAVAFSRDGKLLASASDDSTVRLWKSAGGEPLSTLKGHAGPVHAVAFCPDGRTVVSGGEDRTIRLWDSATGKPRGPAEKLPHTVNTLAFGTDEHLFVSGTKQVPIPAVWRVPAEGTPLERLRLLEGLSDRVYAVAVAADGRAIATGMNQGIVLWRLGAARQLFTIAAHADRVSAVAFSPDGRYLVSGSLDRWIKLWDGYNGRPLHALYGHSADIPAVGFSPDGTTFASASLDGKVRLWQVRDGKLHPGKELFCPGDQFYSVAFSPDGKVLLAGTAGEVRRWDVGTGDALPPLKRPGPRYLGVASTRDGKTIAGACQDGSIVVWDAPTGKVLHRLTTPNTDQHYFPGCMQTVAFSPDGKTVVGGSDDRTIYLWDPETGKPLTRPAPRGGDKPVPLVLRQGQTVKSVAFTADGRFLLSGSGRGVTSGYGDGQVKIWALPAAGGGVRPLCTLVANAADGSWAVVDPRGRYDASNGGDVPWLHLVANNEPVALKEVKEHYYEPRLLDKLLGFNKEPLRDVKKPVQDLKPAPQVMIEAADARKRQLTLKVSNQGGGIGRVQVFVNNKELLADARQGKVDATAREAELQIDLSRAPTLIGKGDQVRIVTYNADGDLAGRGMAREVNLEAGPKPVPPELYAIVAGISAYKGESLNLKFAARDAETVARALEKGAGALFGGDKVHLTLLGGSGKAAVPATKANFQKAFADARKARPQDVFVVFLAGHGLTRPEENLYCYLTQDAASLEPRDYTDPAARAAKTVTSAELVEWIKQVPALKQVMVLDTCAAGAASANLTERRDVSGGQIRAIEQVKDRTGFHVLMGCAANSVSYEASQYQQGLLTYALLEGMQGPALDPRGLVQVDRLFRHAAERVPELARDVGGIQQPLISSPQNEAVAVARLTPADIQLPRPKPLILRPLLTNTASSDDDLGLMAKLRARLSDVAARGPGGKAVAVYVDADEMHDAVRPAGSYTVKGTEVTVRLRLRKNGKTVADLPEIRGTAADLPALTDHIAKAITEALLKL